MLYLHVGLHKTGTSSIQETFFASRARLRQFGVAYFDIAANHSHPLMWAFTANRLTNPATLAAGMSEDDVLKKASAVKRALTSFMEDGACGIKVISGESLSTFQGRDVEAIKAFFDRFECPIRVILYVRNYFDYLNSQVQELVKWGWTLPALAEAVRDGRVIRPNYKRKIARFLRIFGRDAVDVRLFHRSRFVGGDLMTDFCDALRIPDARPILDVRTLNESLTGTGVQLVSDRNALSPTGIVPRPDPLRLDKLALLGATADGSKFRVTDKAMLADYRRAVAEDIDFIERLLGPEAARLLTATPMRRRVSSDTDASRDSYELALRSLEAAMLDLDGMEAANELLFAVLSGAPTQPTGIVADILLRIGNHAVCCKLARALFGAGRQKLAEQAAQRALELDGANLETHLLYAEIAAATATVEPPAASRSAKPRRRSR